jgi:hypothetical protein
LLSWGSRIFAEAMDLGMLGYARKLTWTVSSVFQIRELLVRTDRDGRAVALLIPDTARV